MHRINSWRHFVCAHGGREEVASRGGALANIYDQAIMPLINDSLTDQVVGTHHTPVWMYSSMRILGGHVRVGNVTVPEIGG